MLLKHISSFPVTVFNNNVCHAILTNDSLAFFESEKGDVTLLCRFLTIKLTVEFVCHNKPMDMLTKAGHL